MIRRWRRRGPLRAGARNVVASVGAITMVAMAGAGASAAAGALTMDDAVRVALERNREVIAARLDIEAAQLDVVAARLYPSPVASYSIGNLVLGQGNSHTHNNVPYGTRSR